MSASRVQAMVTNASEFRVVHIQGSEFIALRPRWNPDCIAPGAAKECVECSKTFAWERNQL